MLLCRPFRCEIRPLKTMRYGQTLCYIHIQRKYSNFMLEFLITVFKGLYNDNRVLIVNNIFFKDWIKNKMKTISITL